MGCLPRRHQTPHNVRENRILAHGAGESRPTFRPATYGSPGSGGGAGLDRRAKVELFEQLRQRPTY